MTTQINDNLTRFHEMRNQLDDSSLLPEGIPA